MLGNIVQGIVLFESREVPIYVPPERLCVGMINLWQGESVRIYFDNILEVKKT